MWKTIRIRESAYNWLKELARKEKKSLCRVASEIIAERAKSNFNSKALLTLLIAELDDILRNSTLPAEQKVEKIEALLYTWIVENKLPVWEVRREDGFVMIEVSENVGVTDDAQREVSDNYRERRGEGQ